MRRRCKAAVDARFTGVRAMRFHLAPPFLGGTDPSGRPKKREFGPWIMTAFSVLRRFRFLRGTVLDPFGHTPERRMERALVSEYERDMDTVLAGLTAANREIALELAALPLGDPRLRAGQGPGRGGRRRPPDRAQGRLRRRRPRPRAAGGGIADARRSRSAALLLVAACAGTGVPVERQVVVAGDRFSAVQGEAAFFVRTVVPLEGRERGEVVGATCRLVSSLYAAEVVTPSRVVVPNFGPQSPEITATCRSGELSGTGGTRIVTRWQQSPWGWGTAGTFLRTRAPGAGGARPMGLVRAGHTDLGLSEPHRHAGLSADSVMPID